MEELTADKVNAIKIAFSNLKGVAKVDEDLSHNKVYVDTVLPTSIVHSRIEELTKSVTVLKGLASTLDTAGQAKYKEAAVAEMIDADNAPCGVVRFVQLDENNCAIDGTIDGLGKGRKHAINVFEYGDFSDGFNRIGNHFNPHNRKHGLPTDSERHVGDLGNVEANEAGRSYFRIVDGQVKTWDIIGRCFCVSELPDDRSGNTGKRLACGIIARSASIFENVKKVCACSGKTMWQERQEFNSVKSSSKI